VKKYWLEWRWGLASAVFIVCLALLPQVWFLVDRGSNWQGTNMSLHPDEVAYSTYVASLIRGRPRRNDPYTGRQDRGAEHVPESLFSIQMVPAYLLAWPARALNLTASSVFILLPLIFALGTSLTIFWFSKLLTRDHRSAAAAVCLILGCGTLLAGQGMFRHFLNLPYLIPEWVSKLVALPSLYHLPFLRSYQPAVAFPLFFLLCGLVWLALTETDTLKRLGFAAGAGLTFTVLVFSYFFLWTTALAWLSCIFLLWLLLLKNRRRTLVTCGMVAAFALPALLVYFQFLSRRAETIDHVQALVRTHRPDFFRFPEIAAFVVLLLLIWGRQRKSLASNEAGLFVASLALTVVAVFNQQIITGRSLQPAHYEWFIANYCAGTAVVLLLALWHRESRPLLTGRHWSLLAMVALLWGGGEVWLATSLGMDHNRLIDESRPVAVHLDHLASARHEDAAGVVLVSELTLADRFPTDAPQPVIWAPRMLVFPGVSETENQERFFQQLYYLGFDEKKFREQLDRKDWNFYAGLFPYDRLSPAVSGSTQAISPNELQAKLSEYLSFARAFSRERALSPTLSFLVVKADEEPDYANLDRWYERSGRAQFGRFILYQLKLRN
jgi:hypothetical protein